MERERIIACLIALAVIALAAAALLHAHRPPPKKPPLTTLTLNVKGRGLVLINGSKAYHLNSTSPFTATLKAIPERGWKLSKWLVNSSALAPSPELELTVRGNTTVVAVFEQILCSVRILANASDVEVLVNGSRVSLPYEVRVPWGSLLVIEARAPEGFEQGCWLVNGSRACAKVLKLRIRGDTTIEARFIKLCKVVVSSGTAPWVLVNGSKVSGNLTLWVRRGAVLELEGECLELNETHQACVSSWLVNGRREGWPKYWVVIKQDTYIKPVVIVGYKSPPPSKGEVVVNGNLTEARVEPIRTILVPFTAKLKYLGNGWYGVKGGIGGFFIELPEGWKEVTIEGEVRTGKGLSYVGFHVVLNNSRVFYAAGPRFHESTHFKVVFTDKFLRKCGTPCLKDGRLECHPPFEKPECEPHIEAEEMYSLGALGQSPKVEPYAKEGWLFIDCYWGYVRFRILVKV